MMRKHPLLRKMINESDHQRQNIARALGMSIPTLQKKLSGHIPWKLAEAYSLREMLAPEMSIDDLFPVEDQIKVSRKD